MRLDAPEELLLALRLSRSAWRAMAAWVRSFSRRFSMTDQVGDRELEVELVDVAPRVGRDVERRVVEGAGNVQQRIGVADQGEDVGVDRALARRAGRDGDVDVGDIGEVVFFGLKSSDSRSTRSSGTLTTLTFGAARPIRRSRRSPRGRRSAR